MNNFIYEYYQKILDGSEIVGQWIYKAYDNLIVPGLENKEFFYDPKRAKSIICFFENFVHHTKGRSDLVKLELWQKAALSAAFAIVDENGNRQFTEVAMKMGRKQGKSLIAYGCGEYEFLGLAGEFGPEVYCLAPKLDQAEIVYSGIKTSIAYEPELDAMVKPRKNDLYIKDNNAICKKIAFSDKRSDGYNPHFVICDEYGAWPGEAGMRQYEVMASALGSRCQPMILSISTANFIKEGLYDELERRGTRVLLGDSKEKHLLPLFYCIDDVDKWNDINELKKALPNLGVSMSVKFILDEIAKAEESISKKREFIAKYCCVKQNASSAWLSTSDVKKAISDPVKLEDWKECYCVGGIDLSQTTDLTSACLLFERDGVEYVYSHFWLPSAKLDDAIARDGLPYRDMIAKGFLSLSGENFIDNNDVYNWFIDMVQNHRVYPLVIGYDRWSAMELVNNLKNSGFKMDDVYQGFNMTPAIMKVEGILKDGNLKIGDNDLLKVHLLDTAVQKDNEFRRMKIIKCRRDSHIDGCAALLCAEIVKDKWSGDYGEQLKNKRG